MKVGKEKSLFFLSLNIWILLSYEFKRGLTEELRLALSSSVLTSQNVFILIVLNYCNSIPWFSPRRWGRRHENWRPHLTSGRRYNSQKSVRWKIWQNRVNSLLCLVLILCFFKIFQKNYTKIINHWQDPVSNDLK